MGHRTRSRVPQRSSHGTHPDRRRNGATGQQGGAVLAALTGRGHDQAALVRDPASARAQALADAGVELLPGDLGDRASLVAALQGVDAAFAVATPSGGGTDAETEHGVNIAEAATEAEPQYLVFSSVASADEDTGIPHFDSKYAAEQRLAQLGVRSAVVALELVGDSLTGPQISEVLATAMGRPLTFEEQPIAEIAVFGPENVPC